MPNTKDAETSTKQNILILGNTGSGKTTQIRTLPGKKFAYIFDPNAIASLKGADIEYQEYYPDALEMDATIKGFNKGSRSDTPSSRLEPTTYLDWVNDLNSKVESDFLKDYDWLCLDSITFLQKIAFDRNAYINNRYGKIEELSDYRVVGSKVSDIIRSICSLPINVYITGHITEFQDEVTKKISVEANLAGSAKRNVPLVMTNIWLAEPYGDEKKARYRIQTRPGSRGFQSIRSSIDGLEFYEDVTIEDFTHAEDYGIGKLLKRHKGDH